MSKYLKTKEGSIESAVLKSVATPKEEPKVEDKEYKTSSYFGTKEGSLGDVFNKVMNEGGPGSGPQLGDKRGTYKTGHKKSVMKPGAGKRPGSAPDGGQTDKEADDYDTEIGEKVDNPYAVGMAQAMKSTGDKPPLKKSTITKAHDIAKSIKKDESIDENEYQKVFKKELEKSGKSLGSMSDSEKKDFFNKIDKMYKGKNEELTPAQKKLPPALQKAIAKKMKDKKEEVEETHSYHKIKQNKKQTQADGEKEIIDPNPKLKAEDVIRGLWEKAAETISETDITKDNVKKGDTEKEKELKIKLDKEKDQDTLEKQLIAAQGQINILKQKLENEKNKAIKPEPNPETGEVPLTVGVAYKHLRAKMKKEEKRPDVVSDDEKKETKVKGKADTGSPKTPVDTEPEVDYKN